MISHKLEDDGTVTIRSGLKVVSAPLSEMVALAYRMIEDLDPKDDVAPISYFINSSDHFKAPRGSQIMSIMLWLKEADWTAGALGKKIGRSGSHACQQLLRMEKNGLVESAPIPGMKNRRVWKITREGIRWITANRG